jgi:alkanesulfonate monooxygenase SsuD/methylene tetrahydromethanopterin reductase-like flavin-dependent oxidoreductase (luciferase family)
MELCVMIEGQEGVAWPQWQAIAAACEASGIGSLFRSDHYLPLGDDEEREVLDAWGTTCALAATTTTLELGTLVSPATYRHPSVLAKLAATADEISGGRAALGLGAGWHEREHAAFGFPYGALGERMDVLAEQVEIVRGLWGEGLFSFTGEHYALDAVDARPKPQRPWLIMGGEARKRAAALAARFADEYNTVYVGAGECRERRARLEAAWAKEGRSDLVFSLMTGAAIGRDRTEAADRVRAVGERRGDPGFTPPDCWIHGTVEEAAEQLAALEAAGVDRVMLQLLDHDDLDHIALIGAEL